MLTKKQVLEAITTGRQSKCLDYRDYTRLCDFMTLDESRILGFEIVEGCEEKLKQFSPKAWTKENILDQLQKDVAFGFEKAFDKRGISAYLMYEVVLMWMWILEDDLQNYSDYNHYGLPFFKAVAAKYGFPAR